MTGICPSALIIGDGIAGLLAACVLRRARWNVRIIRRSHPERPHHRHAHMVCKTTIDRIEGLCGARLPGWAMGDAIALSGCGAHADMTRPLFDPVAFADGLAQSANRLGVDLLEGVHVSPSQDGNWRWTDNRGRADKADLLIDAGGAGTSVGRISEVQLDMEELDVIDRCWTWHGVSTGIPRGWTIAARGIAAVDALFVRQVDGAFHMTVRPASALPPEPQRLLDAVMMAAGGQWAIRMGAIRLEAEAARFQAPFARRTKIANRAALPPMIRIGDALLQTAPRFGRGIAQIARHADLLASGLSCEMRLPDIGIAIEEDAARGWTAMLFAATAQQGDGQNDEVFEPVAAAIGAGREIAS